MALDIQGLREDTRYLAEQPARNAAMREQSIAEQKKLRELRGNQLLSQAGKQYTKVNPDGSKSIDYAGLAGHMATNGYPDIANQIAVANINKERQEQLLRGERRGQTVAEMQMLATGLRAALAKAPPEKHAEIIGTTLAHAKNNWGAQVDPLEFVDPATGLYSKEVTDRKINEIIGTANTPQGLAELARTEYSGGVTQEAQDPNSAISKSWKDRAIAAGIPANQVAKLNAATIQNTPSIINRINEQEGSKRISKDDRILANRSKTEARVKHEKINNALKLIKPLQNKGTFTSWTNFFDKDRVASIFGEADYLAAQNALNVLKAEGIELDLTGGYQGVKSSLETALQNTKEEIQHYDELLNAPTTEQLGRTHPVEPSAPPAPTNTSTATPKTTYDWGYDIEE